MHLLLNHPSKIHRFGSFSQAEYLFSATTVSCFSAVSCAPAAAKAKPHFPDPPITPKASSLSSSSSSSPLLQPSCSDLSSFSSSSSSERPVFLSFRGNDTRKGFVKSLHQALCFAGIRAFKDDVDLAKGCRIQRGLMDAIHESWVFIPVISANYASSKWCLEELAEIMKCVKMEKKTVFPVFYNVLPTEVRHLKGPFRAAFAELEDCRKVKTWKRALSEVAEFSGFDLLNAYQR